jgi:hypothetical protein
LLSLDLNNLNEAVEKIINPNREIQNLPSGCLTSPILEILKNVMRDIQTDSNKIQNSSNIQDQFKSLVDNISSNITNLINHTINSIGKENQLKSEIENFTQENFREKLMKDYQEISRENEELKKNSQIIFESGKESIRELTTYERKIYPF